MLEPRTGVFVGRVSPMVRDGLWEMLCARLKGGAGVMLPTTDNEPGYAIRFWGSPNRVAVDFDGLTPIARRSPAPVPRPPLARRPRARYLARRKGRSGEVFALRRAPARQCRPHARGGGPDHGGAATPTSRSSPRAWGWTGRGGARPAAHDVVPTRVGVDRHVDDDVAARVGRPHARGGGPAHRADRPRDNESSPRAWGWTVVGRRGVALQEVVPTRVGVDRIAI